MNKILILILMIVAISCNSKSQNHDSQDSPDLDHDSHDLHDEQDYETQDNDVPDEEPDEVPDEVCYPLLKDAQFPYYDKDGNITFCRPGCDVPTEKDPQCMSNLWKEQNEALCTEHPQYDCCGYPCVLESLKPLTKDELYELVPKMEDLVPMHQCDLYLSRWSNDGTHGVVKSWNMSEGKVGFYLTPTALSIKDWPVKTKAVTYDIATRKYHFIVPVKSQEQGYHRGGRIIQVSDKRTLDLNNRNIFLAYIGDDGRKELIFNGTLAHLPYEPALNDKWAFANIRETGKPSKMMYAKVGEWEWTVLGEGTARYSDIYENKLGIYDENRNGYICDLSKAPKSLSNCLKINRESETVAIIRINRNNSKEFVYNSNGKTIVKGTINDEIIEYEDIITEFDSETSKNGYSISPYQLSGDIMLYVQVTNDGSTSGGLLCYYHLDKKKSYCMKKMERDESYADGTTRYPYGFSEFEGKWLLYQKLNSTPLILRDMECYCEEEGVCPFEE